MGRLLFATACAAVLVGVLAVSGTARVRDVGVPADAAFRLADGSAGCRYFDGRIACRTATMEAAAVLRADGETSVDDDAVGWDDSTPVLRPTESWWHGDFSCRIVDGDILCSTFDGALIAVGDGKLIGAAAPASGTLP